MLEAKLSSVCTKIEQTAREIEIKGGTEEDTRIRVERILRNEIWDELGVPEPSYEYPTRKPGLTAKHWGRLDAFYGLVIFEYKKPGVLDSSNSQEEALSKMVDEYIPGILQDLTVHMHINTIEEAGNTPTITGVIWDARTVLFCEFNYQKQEFTHSQPSKLNVDVLRQIVTRIEATYKRILDPAKLAANFGYKSMIVQERNAVVKLYEALKSPSKKTAKLFDEWRKITSQAFALTGANLTKLAGDYGFERSENIDGIRLYFAIQTYYAIIIKQLAVEVAARFYDSSIGTFLEQMRRAINTDSLHREITRLESGWYFTNFGINNFLEGELFSWYLVEWSADIEDVVKEISLALLEYDVQSLAQEPIRARDLFKLLFEELVPRKAVRQKLGIYTTPDWLAEFVIDEVFEELRKQKRDLLTCKYLDPGAGTGTFLTLLIGRIVAIANSRDEIDIDLLDLITDNIIGFDIDSLAVLTARSNYLIALASTGLLSKRKGSTIEIPVYFANSIITAEELEYPILAETELHVARIEAGDKIYDIPSDQLENALDILNLFRGYINASSKKTRVEFSNKKLQRELRKYNLTESERGVLKEVYDTLLQLKVEGIDSIWIPIIKSHLVSTYFRDFDAVIGNPPWLSYRYISSGTYQSLVKDLIKTKYKLVTDEHLITHMEMALFVFLTPSQQE